MDTGANIARVGDRVAVQNCPGDGRVGQRVLWYQAKHWLAALDGSNCGTKKQAVGTAFKVEGGGRAHLSGDSVPSVTPELCHILV
jgi:hypothetical protein